MGRLTKQRTRIVEEQLRAHATRGESLTTADYARAAGITWPTADRKIRALGLPLHSRVMGSANAGAHPISPVALAAKGTESSPPKPTPAHSAPGEVTWPELLIGSPRAASGSPLDQTEHVDGSARVKFSLRAWLFGDGPAPPDPDTPLDLHAFSWGRSPKDPLFSRWQFLEYRNPGISEEVIGPVRNLIAESVYIRIKPLPRMPEGRPPSPRVLALIPGDVRGDIMDLNDLAARCARRCGAPAPPFFPSDPELEDVAAILQPGLPGDATKSPGLSEALQLADRRYAAGQLADGFEGALLLPFVQQAAAEVIVDSRRAMFDRELRGLVDRYDNAGFAWEVRGKSGAPPTLELPDRLSAWVEHNAAARRVTAEEFIHECRLQWRGRLASSELRAKAAASVDETWVDLHLNPETKEMVKAEAARRGMTDS